MIYIIITTCLLDDDFESRKVQYQNGINRLLEVIQYHSIECKPIIVENNGPRKTFLDDFAIPILYTDNNKQSIEKGLKEFADIKECMHHFNIQDDDFIVKLTGRYIIDMNSQFFKILKNLDEKTDCIIKYGWWENPCDIQLADCITGLIGARCKYVKMIDVSIDYEVIEYKWAEMTFKIPKERIHIIQGKIGIKVCPKRTSYLHI